MPSTSNTMKTMTTNPASTVYSRFRKAFAPSWMAAPISFIRSVPSSALSTRCAKVTRKRERDNARNNGQYQAVHVSLLAGVSRSAGKTPLCI